MLDIRDYMGDFLENSKKEFAKRADESFEKIRRMVLGEDAAKNITAEFPDADKEIDLKSMYDALKKALRCFHEVFFTNSQIQESVLTRFSDYAEQINELKKHMAEVKSFVVGNSVKNGIKCPSEDTMLALDTHLGNTDKYMGVDNSDVKLLFEYIKLGKIHFQDIVEFETFFKQIYMELCSCVLAYYNSVIIAIGDKADFEHSNQYLIEYFNKKNIKNGTSNYPLIPATKNVFGELIYEKSTGETSTKDFITRSDFNTEIAKRQAKNKILQNPA